MKDVVIFLGLAYFPTTIVLVVAYLAARTRAIRAEQTVHDLTVLPTLQRHARARGLDGDVSEAIEALAIEVERIAEGQRFTTRLLSESHRLGSLPSRDDSHGRSITPH
jgi:hypothetical protein